MHFHVVKARSDTSRVRRAWKRSSASVVRQRDSTSRPSTVPVRGSDSSRPPSGSVRSCGSPARSPRRNTAATRPDEIDDVLAKIATTCANAGTDLSNLLRVRALLTRAEDAGAIAAALRKAIPNDPPTVCIAVVPSPLPTPDATVAIDAVAFNPSGSTD